MSISQRLATTIDRLERAGIPYMVTGSLASTFYGEPRSTVDLDVVIDPEPDQLDRFIDDLLANGAYVDADVARQALRDRTQFNAIGEDAMKIDFIVRKDRPFSIEEFGRRRAVQFPGRRGFVTSPEDLIIAKLEWARATRSERQIRDVVGVIEVSGDTLDRQYLERWIAELDLGTSWARVEAELGRGKGE